MQLCLIEIENQNLNAVKWINEFKSELALQSLPMIYGGWQVHSLKQKKRNNQKKLKQIL